MGYKVFIFRVVSTMPERVKLVSYSQNKTYRLTNGCGYLQLQYCKGIKILCLPKKQAGNKPKMTALYIVKDLLINNDLIRVYRDIYSINYKTKRLF